LAPALKEVIGKRAAAKQTIKPIATEYGDDTLCHKAFILHPWHIDRNVYADLCDHPNFAR
jgi:hypothetical protein